MYEIKDIAETKFDKLLEHIDLGELDIVESRTNERAMSEELLGIISAPADDTLSMLRMAHPHDGRCGELCSGIHPGVLSFSLLLESRLPNHSGCICTCVNYSKVVFISFSMGAGAGTIQRLELFKEVR